MGRLTKLVSSAGRLLAARPATCVRGKVTIEPLPDASRRRGASWDEPATSSLPVLSGKPHLADEEAG